MNRGELHRALTSLGVSDDAFDLTGDASGDECYVLCQLASTWRVYYAERGLRTGEVTYTCESDACAGLLQRVTRDLGL